METLHSSLKPAIELFKKHIAEGNSIRVLTHNDADGIASGGIIAGASRRAGASFRVSVEKRLDEQILTNISLEKPKLVIISDFGSGYLGLISEVLKEIDILILDHHLIIGEQTPNIIQVNPLLHGIDGGREISAAGVCYLFAKELDYDNNNLGYLAIVGALGDQQDKGEKRELIGANNLIQREVEKTGYLKRTMGLAFYGYETRPIAKAISYTTSPFIPSLSGREDNCVALLSKIGIKLKQGNRFRSLADLTEDEQRCLFSVVSNHMLSENCDAESVKRLIGWIYSFPKERPGTSLRDGREYSSLLNACARMQKPSIGISITLGDRGEALKEAESTVDEYRKKIGEYLDWVRSCERIKELSNIYILNAGRQVDENIIGVVAGILLSQGVLSRSKPIISSAYSEDGTVKISARAADDIRLMGIHLGMLMQETASSLGGGGGGHDVAAGAYIPQGSEDEFMVKVNENVRREISRSNYNSTIS